MTAVAWTVFALGLVFMAVQAVLAIKADAIRADARRYMDTGVEAWKEAAEHYAKAHETHEHTRRLLDSAPRILAVPPGRFDA